MINITAPRQLLHRGGTLFGGNFYITYIIFYIMQIVHLMIEKSLHRIQFMIETLL